MKRLADRVLAVLAAVACLSLCIGLVDVALPRLVSAPAPPPALRGERDGKLLVRVESGGAPVADALVRVFWQGGDRWYLAASAKTGADGSALFEDLPRGTVWVVAEGGELARSSTQVVVDEKQRSTSVELFTAHRLRVGVRNEQGEAVVRATVLVNAADPLPFGALTGRDGDATLVVGPPPWTVKVSARGYESVTRAGIREDIVVTLRPLATLEVRVERPDGSPALGADVLIAGANLWPARRALTDSRGIANISGLLAGSYDLKASQGTLVSETLFGFRLERGARQSVRLRLGPGRMVAVVVTQGEEEAAPVVVGADVVLAEDGLAPFPVRGRTGADGKVVLGPIASGPASVSASARGFVPRGAVSVPEPLEGAMRVPLLAGGTLEGRVVDARGFPVDGATIEVIGTDLWGLPVAETPLLASFQRLHFAWALPGPAPLIPAGELGVMPGPIPPIPQPGQTNPMPATLSAFETMESVDPWVTRADGSFVATPVTPGRVRALVRHPAYVEGMSKVVNLAPGGRAEVEVVLHVGGTLEGRVIDASGLPVAGARVDVSALRGTLERTTLTATDGSFAFAAIPTAIQIAVARPEDLGRIVLKRTAEVEEGGRAEIEIVLPEPREAVTIKVVDDGGRPVESAQVTLMSLDPAVPLRETRFTSAEGGVTIEQARGLDLRVTVEAPGFTRATRVVERAGEHTEVALRRGVLVSGRVTAVRGRQFVAGASVVLVAEGMRRAALTDAEGVFRFQDVPPGAVRLVVSHPEYASAEVDVTIAPTERLDRPRELEPIDLVESGAVEGEVVDAHGDAVLGARVAAGVVPAYLPAGALPPDIAVTDGRGHFTLSKVAPGQIDIEAYHAQVGRGRARVRIDSGRTATGVRIRLEPNAAEDEPARPGGVAVTLGERGGSVVVVQVAQASEAERAGLEAGDVLLTIDRVAPASLSDARERLSGAPGSSVVLQVRRASGEERLQVTRELVRR